MATTPTYAWPYQGLADPPNGATLGQNLALAAEATVSTLDARIAALEAVGIYKASQVTGGTVASVTFSSIPSTLKAIRISTTTRGDVATPASELMVRINGDTGNNYRHNSLFAQNGSTPGNGSTLATSSARVCVIPAGTATAGCFAGTEVCIEGWNSPHASHLTIASYGGYIDTAGNQIIYTGNGVYLGAGPYTSITLLPISGNFIVGCGFYLEGIR